MVFAVRTGRCVCSAAVSDFTDLLERAVAKFPSRQAFAKAIGLNASRLSRAMNTGDFPFNITNCLRLAQVAGESPSLVLRTAGKGDVADLIESLYGHDRTELLEPAERELLDHWRRLPTHAREGLLSVLAAAVAPDKSRASAHRQEEAHRAGESSSRRSPAAAHRKRGAAQ
jgi:hypothetical protein